MTTAQLADGTQLEFPDGTSQDVISKVVKQHIAGTAQHQTPIIDPTEGNSFGQNVLIGTGKAFVDAGRGTGQILRSVLPDSTSNKLGLPTQSDIAESRKLDAPLMNTAGGKVGNVLGNVAMAVPTAFIPGANTYTGSAAIGGVMGALQPTTQDESRLKNTGQGAAAGIIAKFLSDKAAQAIKNRFSTQQAAATQTNAENAVKNQSLKEGQDLGYVVPPSQANPSMVNQTLEGISGKIKTAQVASLKNQSVTNDLVRKSLNLAPDAPLNKDTLMSVRSEAGKAYDVISQIPSIKTDTAYTNAIQSLKGAYSNVEKEAPELASKYTKEFDNLIAGMDKPEFSGKGANEIIKLLRNEGNNVSPMANAAEKAVGKAQIKSANALEDLIDRTMTANGDTQAVANFRNARSTIAKSYDIEKALTERGNIDPSKLITSLKKGKLTGELKQAAKFSATFPKATQEIKDSIPATSPLDWYGGMTAAAASGNPLPLALIGARPAVRAGILSKAYQQAMTKAPQESVGSLTNIGNSAAGNELIMRSMPAVGSLSSFMYNNRK